MENTNHDKALQCEAVIQWMRAIEESARTPPESGEVTRETAKARYKFCETVAKALATLVLDGQNDEDGILYAAVALAQLYGIRAALGGNDQAHTMNMVIEAGRHMIMACHAMMAERATMPGMIH
jgi:hypothetical protein